jgi:glutaredoxin-related protein
MNVKKLPSIPWKTTASINEIKEAFIKSLERTGSSITDVNSYLNKDYILRVLTFIENAKVVGANIIVINGIPVGYIKLKYRKITRTIPYESIMSVQAVSGCAPIQAMQMVAYIFLNKFNSSRLCNFSKELIQLIPKEKIEAIVTSATEALNEVSRRNKERVMAVIKEYKQRAVQQALRQASDILRPLVQKGEINKADVSMIWDLLMVEQVHEL